MARGAPPAPNVPNEGRVQKHAAYNRKLQRERSQWPVRAQVAGSVAMVLLLLEYTVRWFV